MLTRRSKRNVAPLSTAPVTVKTKRVKAEVKVEKQEQQVLESLIVKKEQKQKALQKDNKLISPPENWEVVFDKLEAFRKENKAAVDTMGCERLADSNASPIVQRFQTLVALMLSSQTKDTVTSAAVIKMQKEMEGGLCLESILRIDEATLDNMIKTVGFHTKKASYIKRTAEILRDQYDGDIPSTIEGLTSLPGVGPKMGYLTLQVAWNKNIGIGVDVHVHRISNRLRWVKTNTPEETRLSLQSWLPKDKWKKINPILVGYGQIVCLPRGPRCDVCPVSQYCPSSEVKKIKKIVSKKVDNTKVESVYVKTEELDW